MIRNMLRFHRIDTNPFLNKLPKSWKIRAMDMVIHYGHRSSHTQLSVIWNNVVSNQVILCRSPVMKKTRHTYRDLLRSTFMPNKCGRCILVVHLLPRKHLIHITNCIPVCHIGLPQPYICNNILQRNISEQCPTLLS